MVATYFVIVVNYYLVLNPIICLFPLKMKKKRIEYREWSPDQIRTLVTEYAKYEGGRVQWDDVIKNLPGRTKQQCISFINNKKDQLPYLMEQFNVQK